MAADYQYAITFSVKDTGLGINPKYRMNLFKPIELLTNSKQKGLSLRISYLLAKALNGSLQLVSSQPGIGSCFEFTLIACDEEPPERYSFTLKNLNGKQILLVDEQNNRVEMCKVFEKYNMKYNIASSYDEVSILHKDKKFNLIVLQVDDPIRYATLFTKTPILVIEDRLSKQFDYSISRDYDEHSFKIKLMEIFSNLYEGDNQKLRILVVEDEQINRIVIEKILRQMGYKSITLACNGEEALNIYKRNPNNFDVLLIDIRMPIMSGFELSDEIHKLNPNARMLGIAAQMVLKEEIRPWFKDFIYKPIDTKELKKMLDLV
jgi:CheY-like chemotaxis protein